MRLCLSQKSIRLLILVLSLFYSFQILAKPIFVNDVTQINPVPVSIEVSPTSSEEVKKIVAESHSPISIGGGRFSMGGQIGSDHTLHIDMRKMNKVLDFSAEQKTIRVQAGIRWRDIQNYIDTHNLSVKIMQSYSSFTVGGSLSVNVHGRYVGLGPVIMSVRSFLLVLPNGESKEVSPSFHPELFYGAIGGYGGLGVITEVTLELADNVKMQREVQRMPVDKYFDFFKSEIRENKKAIFHNADIYPPNYQDVISITWNETNSPVSINDRMMPLDQESILQKFALWGFSELPFGKQIRSKIVDPLMLKNQPIVWRNYEASYDVSSLEPSSRKKYTYVLQEYFVPINQIQNFIPKMRSVFQKHNVNVINVSIRHSLKDPGSTLAWAKEECFAFVVYYKQAVSEKAKEKVGEWTRELIDAALEVSGTYYLPYQLHATQDQFEKAYPNFKKYFELKNKIDPEYRFRNRLWDRYYHKSESNKKEKLSEEQSFLVLPEWYVVFSANELAEHLKTNNFSSFPYFKAIKQFWSIHSKVNQYLKDRYPKNWGYKIIMWVVGASTTVEYFLKGVYESTFGALFEKVKAENTAEDIYAYETQKEYASFIYHTPWYKFPFFSKIKGLYKVTNARWSFRSIERTTYLTLEYFGKGVWAFLIGKATGAAYDAPVGTIKILTEKIPDSVTLTDKIVDQKLDDHFYSLLLLPRYEEFSKALTAVLKQKVKVYEIAGNRRIGITLILNKDDQLAFESVDIIFEEPILTSLDKKRVAIAIDVQELVGFYEYIQNKNYFLEHIYDY